MRGKISYYVLLIFGIIVVGSIILSNGIFPSFPINPLERLQFEIGNVDKKGKNKKPAIQLRVAKIKCPKKIGASFIVDTSGSMKQNKRMDAVKTALSEFASDMPSDGLINLYVYNDSIVEAVSLAPYEDTKEEFAEAVAQLTPRSETRTRDALSFARQQLNIRRQQYPEHEMSVILISDGIPETAENNKRLGKNHQYDASQDPTDIATALKNDGYTVYTVAIPDTLDAAQNKKHQEIMKAAASTPDDSYIPIYNEDLTNVITKISKKMCD
ncbi:MAG: VWA domain-containing protein [Candidatus Levybacteria bacterium]|nr:VWA domain-containing protein [Candidatus Levybacteria bacterium]